MKKSILILFLVSYYFSDTAICQSLFEKRTHLVDGDSLPYRLLLPKDFDSKKTYPLFLFLHGAGERGDDNEKQLTHGASVFEEERERFPAIVVFPQCPQNDYWASVKAESSSLPYRFTFQYERGPQPALQKVISLLDSLQGLAVVDPDRIYLGGLSMGAMGTYELLYRKPGTFAAAVTICGAGDPKKVSAFAENTPVWMFHGTEDNVVLPGYAAEMYLAISRAGGNPKYNLYKGVGHNSWDRAFGEPELFPWVFSQKLE